MSPEEYDLKGLVGVDRWGYEYLTDRNHPLCSRNGRVAVHRHYASVKIGRWLIQGEEVHHKDLNKRNNDPSNLEILSRSEHARLHGRMNRKIHISDEELRILVWELPTSTLSSKLNLSDVAIGKYCRKNGIEKPPRGYWRRLEVG